jgi:hypothetical protein
MNTLSHLPLHMAEKSISERALVLPMAEALEAVDFFAPWATRLPSRLATLDCAFANKKA